MRIQYEDALREEIHFHCPKWMTVTDVRGLVHAIIPAHIRKTAQGSATVEEVTSLLRRELTAWVDEAKAALVDGARANDPRPNVFRDMIEAYHDGDRGSRHPHHGSTGFPVADVEGERRSPHGEHAI